ncbi:MAG: cation:proton antiporter [Candidatus Poribacteria bacterium]|nr:cation:proton antiporter [Candidatus Poribacteria bacterium]
METSLQLGGILLSFAVIATASHRFGETLVKAKLPLITGFMLMGVLAGPDVLKLISADAVLKLRFIDEVSLAFIAFAAGSELYLKELRSRLRSIISISAVQIGIVYLFGALAVFLLSGLIPFTNELGVGGRISVALLAGAILTGRSPSAVIAVINELRAKGPFTKTVLGVTVVMDVLVIVLFAISVSIANVLLTELPFSLMFVVFLAAELAMSLVLGYAVSWLIRGVLSVSVSTWAKVAAMLVVGYLVFFLSKSLRHWTHENLPFEFFVEPLLICMTASFLTVNRSRNHAELLQLIERGSIPIYVVFFTLTGASLSLSVIAETWQFALLIFTINMGLVFVASFGGGMIARDPMTFNRIQWMGQITQAGVGLGLAKEVAGEFPGWGDSFATMMIAMIALTIITGPLLLKWALHLAGETHEKARKPQFDGVRDALIFGLEGQSLALARTLKEHGWQVKIATLLPPESLTDTNEDVEICPIPDLSLASIQSLDTEKADCVITLLSDDENYTICNTIYEEIGVDNLVVRMSDRRHAERFHEMKALVIDPSTALVHLLDHAVRSPSTASLILGMDPGHDVIDLELRNPDLRGIPLRELRLPMDTLIIAIHRRGHALICHGYTRLELGDLVTVVGSVDSLETVTLRFDAM